jgi:NDP-sugar pyrophosphorylase family protein
MPTLFERVREKGGRTVVYPMHEPWLDVGKPEDYRAVQDGIS